MAVKEYDKNLDTLPIIDRKPKSDKEEKFLREVNEYEFSNLEEPGISQSFTYGTTRNKQRFVFFHGQKYWLPRFIANHVESKSTPIMTHKPNGFGKMNLVENGRKHRFRMSPVFN